MEDFNYIIIAILAIYFIYDFYINKGLLKTDKMKVMGLYNMLFLIGIISVAILKPVMVTQYWWLIIVLALPSFIFQIQKFRILDEPNLSKYGKLGVLVAFMVFVVFNTL